MRCIAILSVLLTAPMLHGQSDVTDQEKPVATKLSADEQRELVDSIFQSTKSAEHARDYTRVISSCSQSIDRGLSRENVKYVENLMSWAHNRRGAARIRVMGELFAVGNKEQANRVAAEARQDLERAVELDKTRWRAKLNLGALHAQLGEYSDAIEQFDRVIELQPDESFGIFNRAECRYEMGRYEQALADYSHVLESSPGDLQALTGRAHSLFHLGRLAQAKTDYDVVVKLRGDDPWALANRGDAHNALGNWNAAYDDYTAAAEIKPNAAIYQRTAWLLATCPDPEFYKPQLALQLAEKAIELAGPSADNLDTLAAAQAASGDFPAAQQTQSRAMALTEQKKSEFKKRMAMYENAKAYQQSPTDSSSNGSVIR